MGSCTNNRTDGRTPLSLVTTVLDDGGRVAFRAEEPVNPAEVDPSRRAFRHVVSIPLKDVAPGDYVLRMAVEPRDRSRVLARRELPFSVDVGLAAAGGVE
jgi:hypothetical protein